MNKKKTHLFRQNLDFGDKVFHEQDHVDRFFGGAIIMKI